MIQDKQLLGLGTAALALLILTLIVHSGGAGRERLFQAGMPLVQGLNVDIVGGVVVEHDGSAVHLYRRGGMFQVQELENYPADVETLNALLLKVLGARASERIGAGEGAAAHFGFSGEDANPIRVSLLDKDGQPLTGLEMAAPAGRGTAVRHVGREEVYATEEPLLVKTGAMDYVRPDLTDLPLTALRRITATPTGDAAFEIVVETPASGARAGQPVPRLVTVEDGELADPKATARLVDTLRSLRFEAPRHPGRLGEIGWTGEWHLQTDRVSYRIRLGVADGIHVCAVSAEGPSDKTIQDGLRQVRSGKAEATMKQVDELIQAREKAEVYTRQHASWVYLLPEAVVTELDAGRAGLLQDPEIPSSIGARHILVSFKGADRARVERTREEAEARAAEVLEAIRAEEADFAALAGEYSDDPGSRDVQGDLGVFERGTMAAEFDEAAFALPVGGISGIVETPFGFHIIQRTE